MNNSRNYKVQTSVGTLIFNNLKDVSQFINESSNSFLEDGQCSSQPNGYWRNEVKRGRLGQIDFHLIEDSWIAPYTAPLHSITIKMIKA